MKKLYIKIFFTYLVLLVSSCITKATVNYCAINDITHEIAWFEETGDLYEKGLGWEILPESVCIEQNYKKIYPKYKITTFPYKIEIFIVLGIIFLSAFVPILKKLQKSD